MVGNKTDLEAERYYWMMWLLKSIDKLVQNKARKKLKNFKSIL